MNNSTLDTLEPKHIPSADQGSLSQIPSEDRAAAFQSASQSPLKKAAANTAEKLRETGTQLAEKAQEQTRERVDHWVKETSSHARHVSNVTEKTASELKDSEPEFVSAGFDLLARGVGRVADYFEEKDSSQIAEDGKNLIREHPAAVLGGLAVAGFLAARFLKATNEK